MRFYAKQFFASRQRTLAKTKSQNQFQTITIQSLFQIGFGLNFYEGTNGLTDTLEYCFV